jgi:hypothetical protein
VLFIPKLYCSFISLVTLENKKTFYVQTYNDEGEPLLGKFELYAMSSDNEFFSFLRRVDAKGLELINNYSDEPFVITSLERVIPNEYYQICASHLIAIRTKVDL